MAEDPHSPAERRVAARHLLQHPLTCAEDDPELFASIRRHEDALDRWFTQRLGYRLQVSLDTARLAKSGRVPTDRPLLTATGRPFHQLEYVLLALTLASTVAGPAVVSLRDLVDQVRSAAVDAEIVLGDDASQRRAQVAVLRWMVDHGLATELHNRVDAYSDDAEADAVLRMRPERIAALPLPALVDAADGDELVARAERRPARRTWLRTLLVEDPVVYRHDLNDEEWDELRRRQAEEASVLEEGLGLVVEARAEGVAAIDPTGTMSGLRFPATGTVGHAALLLIGELCTRGDLAPDGGWVTWDDLTATVAALAAPHAKRWRAALVDDPDALLRAALDLMVPLRLAEVEDDQQGRRSVRLLPAAARFRQVEERRARHEQQSLL